MEFLVQLCYTEKPFKVVVASGWELGLLEKLWGDFQRFPAYLDVLGVLLIGNRADFLEWFLRDESKLS